MLLDNEDFTVEEGQILHILVFDLQVVVWLVGAQVGRRLLF